MVEQGASEPVPAHRVSRAAAAGPGGPGMEVVLSTKGSKVG